VLLQVDEPSLPAVLAGHVATESGFSAYRPVETTTATDALRSLVSAVAAPVVFHCCAPAAPLDLFVSAGAAALSVDLDLIEKLDPLGEAIDAGVGLFAGVAPTQPPADGRAPTSKDLAARVRQVWERLGFPADLLARRVVVTPTCGLAGATPEHARAMLTACREAGRRLVEE
jgi:methionine synthase II (cobalamin-independent)